MWRDVGGVCVSRIFEATTFHRNVGKYPVAQRHISEHLSPQHRRSGNVKSRRRNFSVTSPVPCINFSDPRTGRVAYRSGVHSHAECYSLTVTAWCKVMELDFFSRDKNRNVLIIQLFCHPLGSSSCSDSTTSLPALKYKGLQEPDTAVMS
jgi:hypothetical protein